MRCLCGVVVLVCLGLGVSTAPAQPPAARVAAYESLDVPRAVRQVTFVKRAAEPGDRVDQQLRVRMEMESTVRQGTQELEKSSTTMIRHQDRTVIAEDVVEGRTVAARVRFAKYTRSVNGEQNEPPVVGKTYLCRRLKDDTLSVTRDDGSFASPDEFTIVSESMESLGRPNPLADFLAGQTIAVGQTLQVPHELGNALLGTNNSLGTVAKFVLTLRDVVADEGLAVFDVQMETAGAETTQMRLSVSGQLDIETDSCRTRKMTLAGPLGMATTVGSYSAAYTTYVRGKLQLEMTADHTRGE